MKKIILFFFMLPVFFSCSKEDENMKDPDEKEFYIENIKGTIWEGKSNGYTMRIDFHHEDVCTFYFDVDNDMKSWRDYYYKFENPNIHLTTVLGGANFECYIKNKTLTIENASTGEFVAKLIYQETQN